MQRITAGATRPLSTHLGYGGSVVLAVFLVSCSTMPASDSTAPARASPPACSLVFIIHGDGDYLYHDTLGKARRADTEILGRTQDIAQRMPNAEVVIFHQVKRRHVLFLVPRHDGYAYHYRDGRLVDKTAYWRDQGDSHFAPEARLYAQFKVARSPVRMTFYFGHELPEFNGTGYDASYPERPVTIRDLADGLGALAGGSTTDLLVLATCFGGTPHTIGALAPHARYIIASPENLHLSYFDLEPLASLDAAPGDEGMAAFADRFARNAFDRLVGDIQTVASVVVYDVNATNAYRASVAGSYDHTLGLARGMPASADHCDCASDSTYATPAMSKGLTVYYRAPRFGRMKNETRHSGWECWRIAETGREPSGESAGMRP
ncbi:MAG TPA: hypothetical protein VF247_05790 [Candidatus Krumholzibacteria bacterium]